MKKKITQRFIARLLIPVYLFCMIMPALPAAQAQTAEQEEAAVTYGANLVPNNGTIDGILAEGETERTLNNNWNASYPVATFGGEGGDSPAKIKNVDGNHVIALEYSTGNFASFFADVYTDGNRVPEGKYVLRMDLLPVGDNFQTNNVGFNLYEQYSDIRVYSNGWINCELLDNGWLRYEAEFEIAADSVGSIQFWFNTMGASAEQCALYVDNLSLRRILDNTGFTGKTLSILGASTCTYQDCSNGAAAETSNSTIAGNAAFYPQSGFSVTLDDTWWKQAADTLGMSILVNNSWSGSCLLNERAGAPGAYVDRCVQLHSDAGENPDMIAILIGANDYFSYSETLGSYEEIDFSALISQSTEGYSYNIPVTSMEAYAICLHKISQRYPDAEVYCCTMPPLRGTDPDDMRSYNEDITQLAQHYGVNVVDFYNCGIPSSTAAFDMFMGDAVHPDCEGMDAMTGAFLSSIYKNSKYMPADMQTYSVSYSLDNVVALRGTSDVCLGEKSFQQKLATTTSLFMPDVTVIMDGQDITHSCYANGEISIASVTGDINISAKAVKADEKENITLGANLVYNNGTMDGILSNGEAERILTNDWSISYPIGTFGGESGDSPARIKNVDGNNVIALEYSTGAFASFFADVFASGEKLPAGTYRLSMDLMPAGGDFRTNNIGFNLYNQYSDIRIYAGGWNDCITLDNGWLHYEAEFNVDADSVASVQFWFNTMSTADSVLYIDNLSLCEVTTVQAPDVSDNYVANNGTMDGILADGETERTLINNWNASFPVGTFGGASGDSPAKIKNVDGNNVIALEYSTGNFASFYAAVSADGTRLPAGNYIISMDILPVGDNFQTNNIGFHLYDQYTDIHVYRGGWRNCAQLENGWLRYQSEFVVDADSVGSIQFWFNTMGISADQNALYVDNLRICAVTESVSGTNLVAHNGTMDRILLNGAYEYTLNNDWSLSSPVGTFGGEGGDSPAKIKNADGNNVIALEYSTGAFASFFADLYADGDKLPAGTYTLSMDLLPVGEDFQTDNIGFHLVGQYSDIRIYNQGWLNCTELENGWLHYQIEIPISADSVDSIQFWFNTMESSVLYIDNLSMCNIAADKDPVGSVKEWGLVLNDSFTAQFVMDIPAGTAKVAAEVNGKTCIFENVSDGETVSVDLAAAQMTDKITITVTDADGNESKSYGYTIRQYCDYILTGNYSGATKALVSAMLNYGGKAQAYFDYNTQQLANDRIETSEVEVPNDNHAPVLSGKADGVSFYGATLVHRYRTAVRLYFKVTDGAAHTFTNEDGSVAYTPVEKGDMCYVEIGDITPTALDERYTVCVDGSMTVFYGPSDYMIRMYNKAASSEDLKALVRAMYTYWKAAEDYVYSFVGGESIDIPQDGYTNHSSAVKYVKNIGQITGENGFSNTAELFDVCQTDLGIPFYDSQTGQLTLLFGDTYSEADHGGNWRSNVALYTTQEDYSSGIAFEGALTADGAAQSGTAVQLTPGANDYTPLLQANAVKTEGSKTCIPTGTISLNGTSYVFYMEIHADGFSDAGEWAVYSNRVIKSTDGGNSWQQVSGLVWQAIDENEAATVAANFAQIYPLQAGEYVYLYGLSGGRSGGTKLARVAASQFENIEAYEYFVGYADNGDARWQQGAAGLQNSAYIISGPCGEMCVTYNAYLGKYLAIYQSGNLLVYRTADTPDGVFSAPETILTTDTDMNYAYGAFTCEQLSDYGGQRIWILVSEWSPVYNVSQVEIVFN